MTDLPTAHTILRKAAVKDVPHHRIRLDYESRLLRRRRLETDEGRGFLVDLAETVGLAAGDCLVLDGGELVEVEALPEPVLEIAGDLPRLAWHIGNRHTPCQIGSDRLRIRDDHVLEAMLRGLGADVTRRMAAFSPEGGAYGHGRTMGHDHGPGHGRSPMVRKADPVDH